ncbi:hypothetical protein GRG92_001228 [Salmonella bongori]|uniref:Uncharacterized protein n=1 Tax=Salmonella bongori TaxID=54736 RepID=A0A698W6M5_SALBN|nr:hypothetical protein [Salmonella bongori]
MRGGRTGEGAQSGCEDADGLVDERIFTQGWQLSYCDNCQSLFFLAIPDFLLLIPSHLMLQPNAHTARIVQILMVISLIRYITY